MTALLALLCLVPSQDPLPDVAEVVHVRVEGQLDVGTHSLLRRAIARAKAGSQRLVIELDTPGGEVDLMFTLASQVKEATDAGLLTAAWVHDRALSAGTLLALACRDIYMTRQGAIGAAAVVMIGPEGGIVSIQDDKAREKINSAVRGEFRAFAESHGRSPVLAQAMVDPEVGVVEVREDGELRLLSKTEWDDAALRPQGRPEHVRWVCEVGRVLTLTGSEAVELKFTNGIADSLPQVLEKIGARNATVSTVVRARSEDLAAFLDRIKLLLLIGALFAIWAEFKAPGFGLPGICAITCLALLLFGRYLVGLADVPHIVAVAVGLVLIAVELFVVPGTVWFGLAGGVLAIGGLVLASIGPGVFEHELARQIAIDEVFQLAIGLLAAVVLALLLSRFLPKAPLLSRLVLEPTPGLGGGLAEPPGSAARRPQPGERGVALTDLRPVGKVALEQEREREHEALAEGASIARGARVRLIELRAGRLIVEEDRT